MSDNKRIAGTAYVKVDGKQHTLAGSMDVSVNAVTREGLPGLSGVAGYKESPRVPYIEGEFFTTQEFSSRELEGITNASITAELANGKTYLISNAWQAGDIVINAAEGTVTIRFEGLRGKELN